MMLCSSCHPLIIGKVYDTVAIESIRELFNMINCRTAEFLLRHLTRVAEQGSKTGMDFRNLAIVWAPNLLRCFFTNFSVQKPLH